MTQNELEAAIETAKLHQDWRTGGDGPPTNPKELTKALDILIEAAGRYLDLID